MANFGQYAPAIIAIILFIIAIIAVMMSQSNLPDVLKNATWTIIGMIFVVGLIFCGSLWYLCRRGDTGLAWVFFAIFIAIPIVVIIANAFLAKSIGTSAINWFESKYPSVKQNLQQTARNVIDEVRQNVAQAVPAFSRERNFIRR
jgi:uncharacterized BrkB/YihY/UPF0761 family membrane protein